MSEAAEAPASIDAIIEANLAADDAPADAADDAAELPPIDGEDDGEDAEFEAADDGDEADDAAPEPGSEDAPIAVKDLSDSEFVELKIAGEKVVVSMKELANGHIRQRDFSRRVNELRDESRRAEELVGKSNERVQQLEKGVVSLFANPERCFEYMTEHYPDQLEAVARKYAQHHLEEQRLEPAERERRKIDRVQRQYQKQLAAERQRREAIESEQRDRTRRAEASAAIEAPHRRAFADAGSPKLTPDARAAFQKEGRLMLQALEDSYGRTPPEEEIERVFSLLYARHGRTDDAPAPEAPPAPRRASRRRKKPGKTAKLREGADGQWDFSHISD